MRKWTKLSSLALAAVMVAGLASGCGPKDDGNTIVIGGIGPTTGTAAQYGEAVKRGAELAIKEINAAGGVNGIQLKLDFQDDENNAEKAVNAYNTLKDRNMKVLMGTVTSNPCIAVAEKSHVDNIFQLTPSGSAVDCTKYDNAFRVCFNDINQGSASARYIAEKKLATKVGIIYDSSSDYSSGIQDQFVKEAESLNLEVVEPQAFTSDNKTDFSTQVQKIRESGADLVFLPIYYEEAALILKEADKSGLDVKFFGCDGLDGLVNQLGADSALAEGVMLLTPFAAGGKDEKAVAFTEAYKAEYDNETPIQFAADAYDAIYAIKAAMEQANITDASISASDLCDKLKVAMTEITLDGSTGVTTWDASGEPNKEPKGMIIENGEYKSMD